MRGELSAMVGAMVVAALVAGLYVVLIALHVAAIRGQGGPGAGYRPRIALWLAAAAERRRGDDESAAARSLLAGKLDRRRYQAEMAALAARDDAEHPLRVPKAGLR
ncbi:hypothetical protein [Dactylosporangium sp. CA-139066]|uniref:hypothetical protein n=1 Tax=Dactylosporangium sp. CA-139066 TaxID=3239930 RepID=UPI003D91360F